MPWLKTVGCECPECGPDPCTTACCSLDIGDQSAGDTVDTYDVTGKFTVDHSIFIRVTADAGGGATARFQVAFNGSTLYDSGCISSSSASTTVTGPSGTTSIVVTITAPCSGGTSGWDYVICCSGLCS